MSLDERLRRWQLVLGEQGDEALSELVGQDAAIERALAALYDAPGGDRAAVTAAAATGRRCPASRGGWATSASTFRRASCR